MDAPQLFVGGHENHNFSLLPHDLPVHRGFDGCIFDLSVRSTEATQASRQIYSSFCICLKAVVKRNHPSH